MRTGRPAPPAGGAQVDHTANLLAGAPFRRGPRRRPGAGSAPTPSGASGSGGFDGDFVLEVVGSNASRGSRHSPPAGGSARRPASAPGEGRAFLQDAIPYQPPGCRRDPVRRPTGWPCQPRGPSRAPGPGIRQGRGRARDGGTASEEGLGARRRTASCLSPSDAFIASNRVTIHGRRGEAWTLRRHPRSTRDRDPVNLNSNSYISFHDGQQGRCA